MFILIEVEAVELTDSANFSRNAEMLSVDFSAASFSIPGPLPQEIDGPMSTAINFCPKDILVAGDVVRASTSFEYLITNASPSADKTEDENTIVARFECSLVATYRLQEGYRPAHAVLNAFHKANAVFNCWPYFREFVQSSSLRMSIPPPPVPFLRVQVKHESEEGAPIARPQRRSPRKIART